jgi:hypothetical protein
VGVPWGCITNIHQQQYETTGFLYGKNMVLKPMTLEKPCFVKPMTHGFVWKSR